MARRGAKALHLALFLLGVVLYVVFVLPRWWVLVGDIPPVLATAGRIAAGIPIGLAALPVMQMLQAAQRSKPRPPELALRLRHWSVLLHLVAGGLILLAAIVEIWLRLAVGGPWLFAVYGAAGAIAVLALLALYLSFVAEQPPAGPKPATADKATKPSVFGKFKGTGKFKGAKKIRGDVKPSTKRGRKAAPATPPAEPTDTELAEPTDTGTSDDGGDTNVGTEADLPDTAAVVLSTPEPADDTTVDAAEPAASLSVDQPDRPETGGLRNKRPTGKSRHRLRR